MRRRLPRTLLILLVAAQPTAIGASAAIENVCPDRLPVAVGSEVLELPYCSNIDLLADTSNLQRAVVVIHGSNRNADEYYTYIEGGAFEAGAMGQTLLVAPQFLIEEDLDAHALPASTAFWTSGNWKRGGQSHSTTAHPRSVDISSFAVLEEFVRQLLQVAPNLESLVFTGHSAGGQFVQRFAAGNGLHQEFPQLDIRYVVANPSSYMYFSPKRPVRGSQNSFAVPTSSECMSWYNEYKYGLEDLNPYMQAVGAAELSTRYQSRRVTYLLGGDDDDPMDPYLDTSCAGMHQGDHRLDRGTWFLRHIVDHFGLTVFNSHDGDVVPGIDHNPYWMLRSDCALAHLFGRDDLSGECVPLASYSSPTSVEPDVIAALAFEGAHPNPFNPRTVLRFRTRGSAPLDLSIYTQAGSLVYEDRIPADPSGITSTPWKATDSKGSPVASGVYRVVVRQGDHVASGTVVLLR